MVDDKMVAFWCPGLALGNWNRNWNWFDPAQARPGAALVAATEQAAVSVPGGLW